MRGASSLIANLMLRSPRTAYPMSKRAVQLYAEAMAPAFGKLGARINSLSPGMIDTEMGRLENSAGPEMAKMVAITPMERMGRASEIASAVAFLASPAASYVSGTDLLVDGGTVAGVAAVGGPTKL
jgi:NAD(P)-dependent dehydrogenase (short-subunit alcohol dehydrogenase family)